jgi:aspartate aminotransferase
LWQVQAGLRRRHHDAGGLITVGGKQALFNAALALFDPGDEVITHAPYWPTIPEQVKLMGAVPVIVSTQSSDGFTVHADAVIAAISPRTKRSSSIRRAIRPAR